MCMCMHMCVCAHVCARVCTCVCMCLHVCTRVCVRARTCALMGSKGTEYFQALKKEDKYIFE